MPSKPRKTSDADSDSPNDDYCFQCDRPGELICCESCPRVYHLKCLDPPLKKVPSGAWFCPRCQRKKQVKKSGGKLLPKKRKASSDRPAKKERKKGDSTPSTPKKKTPKKTAKPLTRRSQEEVVELSDDSESEEEEERRRERLKRAAKAAREKPKSSSSKGTSTPSSTNKSNKAEGKLTGAKRTSSDTPDRSKKHSSPSVSRSKDMSKKKAIKSGGKSSSSRSSSRSSTPSRSSAEPTKPTRPTRSSLGRTSSSLGSTPQKEDSRNKPPVKEDSRSKPPVRRPTLIESDDDSEDDDDPMEIDLYNIDADTQEEEEEEEVRDDEEAVLLEDTDEEDVAVEEEEEDDSDEEMAEADSESDGVSDGLLKGTTRSIDVDSDELTDEEHEDDRRVDGFELFWKKPTQPVRVEWFPVQRDDAGESVDRVLTWTNYLFHRSPSNPNPSTEDSTKYCRSPRNFYLVKWADSSYRQCTWLPRYLLEKLASHRLRNFEKQKHPCADQKPADKIFKVQFLMVDRVIAQSSDENAYLVKWRGLEHSDATWEQIEELEDCPELLAEFKKRENPKVSLTPHRAKAPKKFLVSPPYLKGSLHDYQLEGLNWLLYSWRKHTNVILADEMGLGKTIQTIAFLTTLFEHCNRGPYLVVVPLSTLRNWEREFAFWAPQLNVISYNGTPESREVIRKHEFFFKPFLDSKGSRRTKHVKFNVLLTTYSMVLLDSKMLGRFPWKCLVVDEAQRLKNEQSKLFQVLTQFKSEYRLLLTGTPLQNNLKELFVLLNFLSSEDFESLEEFEETFANVTKEDQVKRLHALLAPHILRRLKSDVLKHMPSKAEFIVRVDMSKSQKELYKAILTRNYKVLRAGSKSQRVSLNNVLMELQKCCNHPFLVNGQEDPNATIDESMRRLIDESGKLSLLDKMLKQLKEGGHRVLIFSQMTRMLDILEDYLVYKGYAFGRIDGQVTGKDRQERIDTFNAEGSNQFCFLLSTRAGGLGINLATADTVVIYDSDWNPHNDIQAFSRAHRIGQKNRVMIYRLVTRHGVEERIVQTAKEKMMLEHIVVKKLDSKAKLSQSEMDDILRFGTEKLFSEEEDEGTILYDDEAVTKLLDRTREAAIEQEQDTSAADDYLKSFKVAHYDVADEDVQMEEVHLKADDYETACSEESEVFWEKVLEKDYKKLQEDDDDDDEELGKGKRARPTVNYSVQLPSYASSDMQGAITKKKKLIDKIYQQRVSGSGPYTKVYGFARNHRSLMQKYFVNYGYTDALVRKCLSHRWLHHKPPEAVVNLSRALLDHATEPINSKPDYADGVPKLSDDLQSPTTLRQIIMVQLIHGKVEEAKREGTFQMNSAAWPILAHSQNGWGKEQDYHLLQAIVKHGYGNWRNILIDMEWALLPRLMQHLNLPLPDYCKVVLESEGQLKTVSKAPPPNVEDGDDEDEDASLLAEYKSNKAVTQGLMKRLCALEKSLLVEYQLSGGLLPDGTEKSTDSTLVRSLQFSYEQCRAMGEWLASRPPGQAMADGTFKAAYQDQLKSFYFNLRGLHASAQSAVPEQAQAQTQ